MTNDVICINRAMLVINMADTNSIIIVVLIIISMCYSVDIDYYLDEDNDSLNSSSKFYSRRNFEDYELEPSKFNREESIIEAYYYKKRDRNKHSTRYVIPDKEIGNKSAKSKHSHKKPKKIKRPPIINVFKDYSYNYEDYSDDQAVEPEKNIGPRTHDVSIGRNDDEYRPHFFNLEPAVEDTTILTKKVNTSENIWYLAQNLPCWELPILYGELSRKKRNVNVFSIFKDRLHNVIEPASKYNSYGYEWTKPSQSKAQPINKWCEIEPCFGDHTLCLFDNDEYPASCGNNYVVKVPNVLEQIAIVNTVNSMRNRVANREAVRYLHLPSAANMNQVLYSHDLQEMAQKWLKQCLPGSAPCSALDGNMVTELQCTKYAKLCCFRSESTSKCKAKSECFVFSIIGCIHLWFWKAGRRLMERDVQCGTASVFTFTTVQLLWAKTAKIGCAYAQGANGDERVLCNFSPGAPFYIDTRLFCGILSLQNGYRFYASHTNVSHFSKSLGLHWRYTESERFKLSSRQLNNPSLKHRTMNFLNKTKITKVESLHKIYREGWVREQFDDWQNGTISWFAVVVSKHMFLDETESRCDTGESIYAAGETGSLCTERGRTFHGLCDYFNDPTTGHRLMALLASILLFILVLYDLFSGIVRQNN